MENPTEVKYCRRISGSAPCGRPIKKRNALSWCQECRDARLPFWPTAETMAEAITQAREAQDPKDLELHYCDPSAPCGSQDGKCDSEPEAI